MSKKREQSKRAARENASLFRALSDPLRHRILEILAERVASPTEVAEELEEKRDNVAYHFRELAKEQPDGGGPLIELMETDTRRGGLQKFYKATKRPIMQLDSWEKLCRLFRELNTVSVAQTLIGDVIEAIEAGTFDSRVNRAMIRVPGVVDEEGVDEIEKGAAEYLRVFDTAVARSCQRRLESGEDGINVLLGVLAFERPETRRSVDR